jgi:UDP-N-acetylmuramoyl-L-alanyl-D-glutamate--2,6-diaminopimelate ligase
VSLGLSQDEITRALKFVSGVPGRMEMIDNLEGYKIIVDYAHTEDALENVLTTIKNLG